MIKKLDKGVYRIDDVIVTGMVLDPKSEYVKAYGMRSRNVRVRLNEKDTHELEEIIKEMANPGGKGAPLEKTPLRVDGAHSSLKCGIMKDQGVIIVVKGKKGSIKIDEKNNEHASDIEKKYSRTKANIIINLFPWKAIDKKFVCCRVESIQFFHTVDSPEEQSRIDKEMKEREEHRAHERLERINANFMDDDELDSITEEGETPF